MRKGWLTLLAMGAFGLSACGQDSVTATEPSVPGIALRRVSPVSLTVPATSDSVLLAWVHDTLSGAQVATLNDSLLVSSLAIQPASLSIKVGLQAGTNRFVLKLSHATGLWTDTVTVIRGELPAAPTVTLLTPRLDTVHAWSDSVLTVRWRLGGASLVSVTFAGQTKVGVADSLAFRVVLKPGPDTLFLGGVDAFGRSVADTVVVKRGYFQGLADSLANLVVGKWQADTGMSVPQAMRDTLSASPAYAPYKITLDSTLDVRYTMVMNGDQSFQSKAILHFKATSNLFSPALQLDEWVDSIYVDQGTWKVIGDSLEITRTQCSKALSPYISLVNTGLLIDGNPDTHGLAVTSKRDNVCVPEVSRTRIVLEGQAWPILVSGLLPGQDVAMRFVRER